MAFLYAVQRTRQSGFLILWAFCIYLLAATGSYAQTIRYVKPSPSGSGDGSSWDNATGDLQTAINSLSATSGQIWMASGLYKPTVSTGTNSQNAAFTIRSKVAVYGGFTGTENNLSDRIESHPSSTTLSGNVGDQASQDDNSTNLLLCFQVDSTAILDGLVITEAGTGLYAVRSYFQINNCSFVANGTGLFSYAVGAGDAHLSARFLISNCLFQNTLHGIDATGLSGVGNYLTVTNCLFENHTNPNTNISGPNGGALSINLATMDVINCTFRNNHSYYGGVIGTDQGQNQVTMRNCIFFGNGGSAGYENFYPSPPTLRYSLIDRPLPYQQPSVIVSTDSPFVSETSAQLNACSPAVDGGDAATITTTVGSVDLAGNPRFVRRIDMGAYEYQGTACTLDMYSLQAGRWDDVATWSAGRLPMSGDKVQLKHAVTIPQNFLAYVLKLSFDSSGRLIYETGGRLSVNPLLRQ